MNPGNLISDFCSVHHICLSNYLLTPSLISTKFATAFLLCMLYLLQNFQAKVNTIVYLRETFALQVKSVHNFVLLQEI